MPQLIPFAPLIGAVGGLLGGKKSSGGAASTQTQERTPWGPAQPWIQQNIADGQTLQKYYQQNPFNAQQQRGYDNLYANLDHFNGQIAPAMNQFANNMMASQYQRPQYSRPGQAGYAQQPGGGAQAQPVPYLGMGLPGSGGRAAGPFSTAPVGQAFGAVDWEKAKGPWAASYQPPAPAAAAAALPTDAAAFDQAMREYQRRQAEEAASAWSNWNVGLSA